MRCRDALVEIKRLADDRPARRQGCQ